MTEATPEQKQQALELPFNGNLAFKTLIVQRNWKAVMKAAESQKTDGREWGWMHAEAVKDGYQKY